MAIRSILTSYLGTGGGDSALRLAILMAQKYEAHVTGAVWQAPNPLRHRPGMFLTRDIDRILDQAEAEFAASRRRAFMDRIGKAGLADRAEFVVIGSGSGNGLHEQARGHDVVVMGGGAIMSHPDSFPIRPDVVALRSGRPVVIVPPDFTAERFVETAVVAWDGRRASARALADAMHILGTKEKVTVLTVGDKAGAPDSHAALRLLSLHGIQAELLLLPAGARGTGQTILDTCAERNAGLLVMGAYEHSKFSEDLLGGVTRDILENARLPVLMSH